MPHLIIEHSSNVGDITDVDELVTALHEATLATGLASRDALRTRAVARERFAIADRHPDNAFVAVVIRIGEGRTDDEKRTLVSALATALDEALGDAQRNMMLSVECQEIDGAFRINKNNLRAVIAQRGTADRNG